MGTTPPLESDHAPYQLMPNGRLKIARCDTCDIEAGYNLFAYELQTNTLILNFIRIVDPELSAEDLRFEAPYQIAGTVAPFQGVG
jgi:hypothetical protein